jgi:hypothetical protein
MFKLNPHRIFMAVVEKVKRLADGYVAVVAENAELKQKLADAMADDAADDAEVEAAQLAADQALAKVRELQTLVDADALEDADISALVDAALPPEPVPNLEDEPVAE